MFIIIYWREYNVNITNRPNPDLSIGHIHVCTHILEELRVCRFLAYLGALYDEAHDQALSTKKDEGQSPKEGPKTMFIRSPFMHIHTPR
jgi:hypothetical protein